MKLRRIFCRVTALCLVLLCLFTMLTGCSKYRLEMSNETQSRVMMRVGETDVAFEVVYFFYHTYKAAYPEDSHEALLARADKGISELYAVFALCPLYEIDPYGEYVNELLNDYVVEMIDSFPTRRDYIDRITSQHMTDAVSRLLIRSYICEELLLEAMEGELGKGNAMEEFLSRDDVFRVLAMTLDFGDQTEAMKRRAEDIMGLLAEARDTDAAFLDIARRKATSDNAHSYITLSQWYNLCGEDAPAPAYGKIVGPLYEDGVGLIMRVSEKDLDYAKEHIDEICPSYLDTKVQEKAAELAALIQKNEHYAALTAESFAK